MMMDHGRKRLACYQQTQTKRSVAYTSSHMSTHRLFAALIPGHIKESAARGLLKSTTASASQLGALMSISAHGMLISALATQFN
jgi:hypothetical protein